MKKIEMLVEIANKFHKRSLDIAPIDYGGSVADLVEGELVAILNEQIPKGKIKWLGFGKGYGWKEQD